MSAKTLVQNLLSAALSLDTRTIIGTTGVLAPTDMGDLIETTSGSAVTLTLPNDLAIGFNCLVRQAGAGRVTFSTASGATIRQIDSYTATRQQWAEVAVHVRANADGASAEYVLTGDMS